ncbi:exodeoxyribonuclease III [Helicobacter fennelliae]|uniref:Exodeoxyribonuclease III n=1 Tax=Helicobacter fennelliae MRY12-0050 TaxID=1325130 RepID=T1CXK5_9HELI|nr:exodeoxyribonuclease III [Helicobacter fennelliae]GAD18665.1 Exodeoxyribonuclease III [Helicobacter fennelliae MRY12-0050]STP07157.1 exodeoxyribonuclease [Helicobacter fennelliae]STQ83296.1 exodeoxyribonuclease [Helicobacter fennelliae]
MNLISWNVNGLRACMNKGFMEFFNAIDADVFCIQESKMQRDQASFDFPRYEEYWNSAQKKGYSGVAIFSKTKPLSVSYDMGIAHHDLEGRIITAEYKDFYLVNVYTPNSKRELERLEYRMEWEDDFRAFVKNLEKTKPVVICGDLNVAHKEIDLKNPKTNRRNAGFTDEERKKFSKLLDSGFTDTFRYFYPDKEGAYSWWSYMGKARENNTGWRIDYFLCSQILDSRLKDARIYPEIMGSDHCPVGLEIDIS